MTSGALEDASIDPIALSILNAIYSLQPLRPERQVPQTARSRTPEHLRIVGVLKRKRKQISTHFPCID